MRRTDKQRAEQLQQYLRSQPGDIEITCIDMHPNHPFWPFLLTTLSNGLIGIEDRKFH